MGGRIFQIMLWIALIAAGGYYFYTQKYPCESPITYRIGSIDPRFGVSTSTFLADINQAAGIWEKSVNKDIFKYDPKGSLTINLVYDSRQQITEQETAIGANIHRTTQEAASIKQQYSSLEDNYHAADMQYQAQLAEYNQARESYDTEVSYWNGKGGAPEAEFTKLQSEKNDLSAKRTALEQKRQEVNQLASQINSFIDKYNLLVKHINSDVSKINNDGLSGTEFEEGVYISDGSGRRINIYEFKNKTDLIRALAHELGHSRNLDHNNNPNSIMNPVNSSNTLSLSSDDLQALKTECGIN